MENRTAEKLTAELRSIARTIAARIATLPDDDAEALALTELHLRNAVDAARKASSTSSQPRRNVERSE
jgi:hypothetical protein